MPNPQQKPWNLFSKHAIKAGKPTKQSFGVLFSDKILLLWMNKSFHKSLLMIFRCGLRKDELRSILAVVSTISWSKDSLFLTSTIQKGPHETDLVIIFLLSVWLVLSPHLISRIEIVCCYSCIAQSSSQSGTSRGVIEIMSTLSSEQTSSSLFSERKKAEQARWENEQIRHLSSSSTWLAIDDRNCKQSQYQEQRACLRCAQGPFELIALTGPSIDNDPWSSELGVVSKRVKKARLYVYLLWILEHWSI